LSLSGYRLPTEAEMEYATRAGASTSRYYGESDDLLSEYEWYNRNSEEKPWPVGLKKPNDWGLFDVQGNVWIWCQEGYAAYPATKDSKVIEDKEGDTVIFGTAMRVLRGGSFFSQVSDVRSAYRLGNVPTLRTRGFGFRPSRTLPLVPLTPLPPSPEGESK
jgi:formylglycine-generating enzyme required for sulfatase activity